ncbi:hypothetical protein STEG23_021668, partial [Scotinomys teguina]
MVCCSSTAKKRVTGMTSDDNHKSFIPVVMVSHPPPTSLILGKAIQLTVGVTPHGHNRSGTQRTSSSTDNMDRVVRKEAWLIALAMVFCHNNRVVAHTSSVTAKVLREQLLLISGKIKTFWNFSAYPSSDRML